MNVFKSQTEQLKDKDRIIKGLESALEIYKADFKKTAESKSRTFLIPETSDEEIIVTSIIVQCLEIIRDDKTIDRILRYVSGKFLAKG